MVKVLIQMFDESVTNQLKLAEINDKMRNNPEPVIDASRRFIHEGTLYEITGTGVQDRV